MKTKRASLQSRLQEREGKLSRWLGRIFLLLTVVGEKMLPRLLRNYIDRTLDRVAGAVMELIFCRAMALLALQNSRSRRRAPKTLRAHDHRARKLKHSMRSCYGSFLRHAVMAPAGAGLLVRVEKIRIALAHQNKLIMKMVRRFSRGLTRIGFAVTRAPLNIALGLEMDARHLAAEFSVLTFCADALPDTS